MKREHAAQRADSDAYEPDQTNTGGDDKVAASISHKLGQADPLADFHKLEV